jgi:hypothetical protein
MVRAEQSHLWVDCKAVQGQVVRRRMYGDRIVHLNVVYGGEGWGIPGVSWRCSVSGGVWGEDDLLLKVDQSKGREPCYCSE